MTTITELSEKLQHLFTWQADRLAKQTGFVQRERVVSGSGFAQALVFGSLAEPQGTRKQLQQYASLAGLRVSVQGLDQRFTASAVAFMRSLLEAGLEEVVQSNAPLVVLPRFNGVYLTDCTRLVWGATGVKLAVRLELQRGQLQASLGELLEHNQRVAVVQRALPAGALHLGDLGFFKLSQFREWTAAGVFWLTRYKVGTRLYTPDGQVLDLPTLLDSDQPLTLPVRLGSANAAFNALLVAAPLPSEALLKRQARLHEQARLDQRPLSQRQAGLAHWTLYLTNVPDLSFEQAHTLARTRWQIELLFKLWKSHGHVLRSRSANPIRQQCEGYAKLLGLLVAHWTLLVSGWPQDRLGALDALRLLRLHLPPLLHALTYPSAFDDFFYFLMLDLRFAPRRSTRRRSPFAYQFWYAFDDPIP